MTRIADYKTSLKLSCLFFILYVCFLQINLGLMGLIFVMHEFMSLSFQLVSYKTWRLSTNKRACFYNLQAFAFKINIHYPLPRCRDNVSDEEAISKDDFCASLKSSLLNCIVGKLDKPLSFGALKYVFSMLFGWVWLLVIVTSPSPEDSSSSISKDKPGEDKVGGKEDVWRRGFSTIILSKK